MDTVHLPGITPETLSLLTQAQESTQLPGTLGLEWTAGGRESLTDSGLEGFYVSLLTPAPSFETSLPELVLGEC